MTPEDILRICLKKHGATLEFPFGEIPACVKVRGRIFAQVYPRVGDRKVTLKCEPIFGEMMRRQYPGAVTRGYHCPPVQQPYWNTVALDGTVPDGELLLMIGHAYEAVVARLPKREREALRAEAHAESDSSKL